MYSRFKRYTPWALVGRAKDYMVERSAQLRIHIKRDVEQRELRVHLNMDLSQFVDGDKVRWRINDKEPRD